MKRISLSALLILLASICLAGTDKPLKAHPDITNELRLSNRDNNWIRCDQPISDVQFSEEKYIKVLIKGKSAYIKFLVITGPGGKDKFVRQRSEFIINCSGRMYKILAWPRNVESQTVLLTRGAEKKMESNLKSLAPLSEDERISKILLEVWKGQIPDTWDVVNESLEVAVFESLEARQTRVIKIDGPGYRVREFVLKSRRDGLRIREKDFLHLEFSKAPLAIAADPMQLDEGQTARLVIVESVNQDRSLPLMIDRSQK